MLLVRYTLSIITFLIFATAVQASPAKYVDFMPKYRSEHENLLLTKISYTEREMLIYFTYVSKSDNTIIEFSGAGTDTPWKLFSSFRSRTSGNLEKFATLREIVMDGKVETEEVGTDESLALNPRREPSSQALPILTVCQEMSRRLILQQASCLFVMISSSRTIGTLCWEQKTKCVLILTIFMIKWGWMPSAKR